MKFTRRWFLLVFALLAALDYGRSLIVMDAGAPPGWKTERWQAGFGSWANGGYGVAYDVSMPRDYDFVQKCGRAWINDDVDGPDFDTSFAFRPLEKDREDDFALYMKEDAGRYYEAGASVVTIGPATPIKIRQMQFVRRDLQLDEAKVLDDEADRSTPAKGFWLAGEKLSIIADLRDPRRAAINERIVGSVRKAYGYGLTELFFATIPGLLGC